MGPPRWICSRKIGTTLPLEPSTLPKRTEQNLVCAPSGDWRRASESTYSSVIRLVAPITEVGLTALSVEISTNAETLLSQARSATVWVPTTLLCTASAGFFFIMGTRSEEHTS